VQVYITAVWTYYRHILEEWGERGRKVGRGMAEKGGEKEA